MVYTWSDPEHVLFVGYSKLRVEMEGDTIHFYTKSETKQWTVVYAVKDKVKVAKCFAAKPTRKQIRQLVNNKVHCKVVMHK